MPKKRFFGGIALIAAASTGCGMATASPERELTIPAEPTMISFVDPSHVDGLTTRTLTSGDAGGREVHIVYPDLRDAPDLNRKLDDLAQTRLRRFTESTESTDADAPRPRPELNVDWQLTAATDDIVGVRLRTGEFAGANWANSLHTVWYDRVSEKVVDSPGLVTSLNPLTTIVREQLRKRGSEVDYDAVRPDPDLFDSMAFNPAGDLVVEFDDYQVGPGSLGRVAVAVPGELVEPLLSETGRRAREAAKEATPSPAISGTPTTSPPATSAKAGGVDCEKDKCVALTFDDGPGPYTGELLEELRKAGARATFFTVGTNVAASPELVDAMREQGHLVANHTWSHRDLTKLSSSKITDAIGRAQSAISLEVGQTPTLLRPPYGAVNEQVTSIARKLGLALVNWDVDTTDGRERNPAAVARRAVAGAHPGAIILMHDVHRTTVEAVPAILRQLTAKGYTFVTVPELYGSAGMQPGRIYYSGKQPLT
ncbi:polysaccharide deacetylase family protein [Nonomuraea africana]|uniref:Peptidoglycan/xylan/chitin deacetylase (PgdA/CDA1 family) n=1 Tax=Nonomuraea africana TaxID=46171 RepID=A0ABR9KSL4_9ACTN|nr:polysaccharide deacetylase family protein [Nonomuraea africana]MBE1565025.1 peptidoglycan/xylan/chitin deacetylase (PgdA/CDA1 family) [Nonomuraea africana]